MSIKKSNAIVSLIIVVASVGALFGVAYPSSPMATTVTASSIQRYTSFSEVAVPISYFKETETAVPVCTNVQAIIRSNDTCAILVFISTRSGLTTNYATVPASTVISLWILRPSGFVNTFTNQIVESDTSLTLKSTTIVLNTVSEQVPIYVSTFHINQTAFTYLAFLAIIGAVALAVIIAYPKKPKSQSDN